MTSPMLTVIVLVVLWLIVVVPMVLRRKDAGAGERSVSRFGASMRALGSRGVVDNTAAPDPVPSHEPELHVPGGNRVPVPASKESLMYPPDRAEMSEARRAMMARRRRSLTGLGAGTFVCLVLGLLLGSVIVWALFGIFAAGLAGYVLFLRSQAQHDRDRRENRLRRAAVAPVPGYELTTSKPLPSVPSNAVRIDDDDIHLDHIDTVDLTGLYTGDAPAARRPVARPAAVVTPEVADEDETNEGLRRAG